MKKIIVRKFIAHVLMVMLVQFSLLLSGCGNQADNLYTEGKNLINDEETRDEGIENLKLFEQKFPFDPRVPEVVLVIASFYHSQKNYEKAILTFERLIEQQPETREAYKAKFLLGYIYLEDLNETGKAANIFNDFIQAYPDSELTLSAKILLENINIPVEEWSIVKELEVTHENGGNTQDSEIER